MLGGMERRDRMRAADADREMVAEQLRDALNAGRLDLHEYDERLQRAYAAKTYGELDGLLADLPGTVPPGRAELATVDGAESTPARSGAAGSYPGAVRGWLGEIWGTYLSAVGAVVGIWAVISVMSADLLYFWPGWVAGPWGAVLLVRTVTGLLAGEPQRRAADRARRADRRRSKRKIGQTDPKGTDRQIDHHWAAHRQIEQGRAEEPA